MGDRSTESAKDCRINNLPHKRTYELCILHAIGLYTYRELGKGGMSVKQRAETKARVEFSREILDEMPRDRTLAEVKRLATLLPKDVQLQELVEYLSKK